MSILEDAKLLKKYRNKWLALTDDEKILCSGTSLKEVLDGALSKGISDPVTLRVPDLRYEFVL